MIDRRITALRTTIETLGSAVVTSVLSSVLGVVIARRADPLEFGVVSVSFELLYLLSLHLGVEAVRRAAMREIPPQVSSSAVEGDCYRLLKCEARTSEVDSVAEDKTAAPAHPMSTPDDEHFGYDTCDTCPSQTRQTWDSNALRSSLNLSTLGIVLTVLSASVLGMVWYLCAPNEVIANDTRRSKYSLGVLLVVFGAIVQSFAEPLLVRCYRESNYTCRSRAELAAMASLSITKAVGVLIAKDVILGFASGYLAFGVAWTAVMFVECRNTAGYKDYQSVITEVIRLKPLKSSPGSVAIGRVAEDDRVYVPPAPKSTMSFLLPLYCVVQPIQRIACIPFVSASRLWHSATKSLILVSQGEIFGQFILISLQKMLLSHGEKAIALVLFNPSEWGPYGLVSGLAGLICRVIFSPLEEIGRGVFSKAYRPVGQNIPLTPHVKSTTETSNDSSLSASHGHIPQHYCDESVAAVSSVEMRTRVGADNDHLSGGRTATDDSTVRHRAANEAPLQTREDLGHDLMDFNIDLLSDRFRSFRTLFFIETVVGLFGFAFGPSSSFGLISLAYGTKWNHGLAPQLLGRYCLLLLLMSINGMLESYVFSQADAAWLRKSQFFNMVTTLVFILTATFLVKVAGMGVFAMIYANGVTMVMRICFCITFIISQIREFNIKLEPWWSTLRVAMPDRLWTVTVVLAVSGIATRVAIALFGMEKTIFGSLTISGFFFLISVSLVTRDIIHVFTELRLVKQC